VELVTERIAEAKQAIEQEVACLDNIYVQIKLHHERRDFEKAARLFADVRKSNERIGQLKKRLEFYQSVGKLVAEGILVEVVKKADENLAMAR